MTKPNGVSEEFTRAYKKLPSLSIDHGVMERSSRAAVIPVAFTWSDVGNWSSLEEVAALDRNNNVVSGNVVDCGQPQFGALCRPASGCHDRLGRYDRRRYR